MISIDIFILNHTAVEYSYSLLSIVEPNTCATTQYSSTRVLEYTIISSVAIVFLLLSNA